MTRCDGLIFVPDMRRRKACAGIGLLLGGLSACTPPPKQSPDDTWEGRLAVHISSEPPQEFFANFELTGSDAAGVLQLISPLGTTLLHLKWDPTHAEVTQGSTTLRKNSLTELQHHLHIHQSGIALPIEAWFGWLKGRPTQAPGWEPDLSEISRGRLSAHRHTPLPEIRVKLIFTSSAPT